MEFSVLGTVQGWHDQRPVPLGGPSRRRVLAVLLLGAGQVVPLDRMVELVWGDRPPAIVDNAVQTHVCRLRKALAADRELSIASCPSGYVLRVSPSQVDLHRFRQLVARARAEDDLDRSGELLREAIELWRGRPLADVATTDPLRRLCAGLEEERLSALEERLSVDLRRGRHAEVVGELASLAAEYPFRESIAASWVLALYRCGRQADALGVLQRIRERLIDELGVEPGPPLRSLHQRVLRADPTLDLPARPPACRTSWPSPAQLPADIAGFCGRAGALHDLDALLNRPGGATAVVIAGTAGVGKTSLAVRWAHRVRDRFRDGQLHVDLRGYASGQPVPPIQALAQFLYALGVPAEQVPVDVDTAAGLFRTMLADKNMLVLLDNARSVDQVRPLLPGSPGCLVVVTSRDRLAGLVARQGAHLITLEVLTAGESVALLSLALGRARVDAERAAADELGLACAHLPLALRIAAAHLTSHPHRSIADQVAELRAGDRLTALEVPGDQESSVCAAFDLSYAARQPQARRLFRLLGLVPGPDVTADAAAALAGLTTRRAAALLDDLASAHLVNQPADGRYALHDLLRVYAGERCHAEESAGERDAALRRLHDWYRHAVHTAATQLYPHMLRLTMPPPGSPPHPVGITDNASASAWLDAERRNLIAVIHDAAERGPHPVAWQLAQALRGYFFLRRHTNDWLATTQVELAAARAAGDRRAEAAARLSMGEAHLRHGQHRAAVTGLSRAVRLSATAEWPHGQAAALAGLGTVYWRSGHPRQAVRRYLRALALFHELGRKPNQASILGNLSLVYRELGKLPEAVAHYSQALTLFQETNSRYAEAVSLGNLGEIHHDLGNLDQALDHLTRALTLHREIADRGSETDTLRALAAVHLDLGHHTRALDYARTALTLARDTTNPYAEAAVLHTIATIHQRHHDHANALDHHQQAHDLARTAGNRYLQTAALIGLAATHRQLGHPDQARAHASYALTLASQAGYQILHGNASAVLASIATRLPEPTAP